MSDFERCSELRDWRRAHAGDLPRQRSDNEYEQSLARWYSKALQRQHRALSSRPSQRQLIPDETAHLDSIVRMAIEAPAAAPVEPLRKRQRAKSSSAPGSASSSNASPAPSSCAPPGLRHSGGRQSNRRGKVVPHKDGFRVQATIDKKTVYGPLRSTEADLILRYPDGSWRPVVSLQAYARWETAVLLHETASMSKVRPIINEACNLVVHDSDM